MTHGDRRPADSVEAERPVDRKGRTLLALAAVAVGFAAADTYVVVLSLPEMMGAVGLSVEQLQRAAPIVSGFLLGYVAMLPLIGRIADLRERLPVLVAALTVFAFGSMVTAAAYDLVSLVVGRFLQGVGGGGLVPVTLALVADLYPAEGRGVPLGVVGAVQELGSVLGPLFGAVVLTFGTWRDIFWINLAVGLILATAIAALRLRRAEVTGGEARGRPDRDADTRGRPDRDADTRGRPDRDADTRGRPDRDADTRGRPDREAEAPGRPDRGSETPRSADRDSRRRPDLVGMALLALWLAGVLLVMRQPEALVTDVTWGAPFVPFASDGSVWLSPLGLVTIGLGVALFLWLLRAPRPLIDVRGWWRSARQADLPGAILLAVVLGGVILAFATADPEVQVLSPAGPWFLGTAAVGGVAFWVHQRRAEAPLIPRAALSARAAWGSLLVSFLVGSALIAALVDIPVFARLTVASDSQLHAALVLVEFLVALPIGALAGGYLVRRVPAAIIAAAGLAMTSAGFVLMSRWGVDALSHLGSSVTLALTGLGFGLALAPVNAALLASTSASVHGVASALLVVARMVGMLIGISALTTIGLRRYYAVAGDIPSAQEVCGTGVTRCDAYTDLLRGAGIAQLHAIFIGAAVSAGIAAVLGLVLLRGAATTRASARSVRTGGGRASDGP